MVAAPASIDASTSAQIVVLALAYDSRTKGNVATEIVKYFLQLHFDIKKDYRMRGIQSLMFEQGLRAALKRGVETADQRLLAEARVEPEGHLPKKEIAEGVVAVLVGELKGLHDIADGLGHLSPADRPIAVDIEPAIERDARGVEHGRPVHGVRREAPRCPQRSPRRG